MSDKLVLVTGAVQGIGLEIVKKLLQSPIGFRVILSGRRNVEIHSAYFKDEILKNKLYLETLDISSESSISNFIDKLKEGCFDNVKLWAVVHNASIAFKRDAFGYDECKATFDVNVNSVINFADRINPFVTDRVIIMGSSSGHLKQLTRDKKEYVLNSLKSSDDIINFAKDYLNAVRDGNYNELFGCTSMYGFSKICQIAYAIQVAPNDNSVVVCPGWCQTSMSSFSGPKTAAEGADSPVWLLEMNDTDYKLYVKKFVRDRRVIVW